MFDQKIGHKSIPSFDIRRELFDWSESFVAAILIIVVLFAFFVRSIAVDGTSMIDTLHDGDYLIVSNLFYDPQPGDIVVLTKKTFMTDSIVKRIIAVGGQTIDMDFSTGEVWVDGEARRTLRARTNVETRRYDFPRHRARGLCVCDGG